METQKFELKKILTLFLSVPAVMFCKQFLSYAVHIDWCNHGMRKHSCRSQHISVLTTCTFMF